MKTTAPTIALVLLCISGCTSATSVGDLQSVLDVSGVWTSTLGGTVFSGESGGGESTAFTMTLSQSNTAVTGSLRFQDSKGRSGTRSLTGSLDTNLLTISVGDFDPACGGRTFKATGNVIGVTSGSTLSLTFTAPGGGSCSSLSSTLTYRKQ